MTTTLLKLKNKIPLFAGIVAVIAMCSGCASRIDHVSANGRTTYHFAWWDDSPTPAVIEMTDANGQIYYQSSCWENGVCHTTCIYQTNPQWIIFYRARHQNYHSGGAIIGGWHGDKWQNNNSGVLRGNLYCPGNADVHYYGGHNGGGYYHR